MTLVIGIGPGLFFIGQPMLVERGKEDAAYNIRRMDEEKVLSILTEEKEIPFEQRQLLTMRLAEIYASQEGDPMDDIKKSCEDCNANVLKLTERLDAALSKAENIEKRSKRAEGWVFGISFIGILSILGLKLRNGKDNGKKWTGGEILLLLIEWLVPTAAMVITNPWYDFF